MVSTSTTTARALAIVAALQCFSQVAAGTTTTRRVVPSFNEARVRSTPKVDRKLFSLPHVVKPKNEVQQAFEGLGGEPVPLAQQGSLRGGSPTDKIDIMFEATSTGAKKQAPPMETPPEDVEHINGMTYYGAVRMMGSPSEGMGGMGMMTAGNGGDSEGMMGSGPKGMPSEPIDMYPLEGMMGGGGYGEGMMGAPSDEGGDSQGMMGTSSGDGMMGGEVSSAEGMMGTSSEGMMGTASETTKKGRGSMGSSDGNGMMKLDDGSMDGGMGGTMGSMTTNPPGGGGMKGSGGGNMGMEAHPSVAPTSLYSIPPSLAPSAEDTLDDEPRNGGDDGEDDGNQQQNSSSEGSVEIPASLQLSLASFKYETSARWDETHEDDLELLDVTKTMFGDLLSDKFSGSKFDFVDVLSYEKLAPRVFEFVVSIHFTDSTGIPELTDIESAVSNMLEAGQSFNNKYVDMLKKMKSTIFATTYAVKYISNKHELAKAVAEAHAARESDDNDDDGFFAFFKSFDLMYVVAAIGVVALLVVTYVYCYCRRRRARQLHSLDFSGQQSHFHDHTKNESLYKTNSFSHQSEEASEGYEHDSANKYDFQSSGLDPYAVAEGSEKSARFEEVSLADSETMSSCGGQEIFRASEVQTLSKNRLTTDPFNDEQSSGSRASVKNKLAHLEAILGQQSTEDDGQSSMGSTLSSFPTNTTDLEAGSQAEEDVIITTAIDPRVVAKEDSSVPSTTSVKARLAQFEGKSQGTEEHEVAQDSRSNSSPRWFGSDSDSVGPHRGVATTRPQTPKNSPEDATAQPVPGTSNRTFASSNSIGSRNYTSREIPRDTAKKTGESNQQPPWASLRLRTISPTPKESREIPEEKNSLKTDDFQEQAPWMALRLKATSPPPPAAKDETAEKAMDDYGSESAPEWMKKFDQMGLKKSEI